MDYYIPSVWIAVTVLILLLPIIHYRSRCQSLQHTIDHQKDTIQRLVNREPVTYAEVGMKPQKPIRERYAAWGAQMVDLDEEETT